MIPTILILPYIFFIIFISYLFEKLKRRFGINLSQQLYIDSLTYMKTRVSQEDYFWFFSFIVTLSNIPLFRHLLLPNISFYLKFHKNLVPNNYIVENNALNTYFQKLYNKYITFKKNTSSEEDISFPFDKIDTVSILHTVCLWFVYLGITNKDIDIIEEICDVKYKFYVELLRIEILYASLLNGKNLEKLDTSVLNVHYSIIHSGDIMENPFSTRMKKEMTQEEYYQKRNEIGDELGKFFFGFDYLCNRAYFQSKKLIKQLPLEIKSQLKLSYCINSYNWPKDTIPKPRYNILVIGESGAGKSTFINSIFNYCTYDDPENVYDKNCIPIINSKLEDFETEEEFLMINILSIIMSSSFKDSNRISGEKLLAMLLDNSEPDTSEISNKYLYNKLYTELRFKSIFFNKDLPEKQDQSSSVTQACTTFPIYFNDKIIQFIDTPGLNDTESGIKDLKNIEIIKRYLENISEIHFILFIVNSNLTRLRNFIKDYLNLFDKKKIESNFGFMFTHINQESIHTVSALTEGIELKIFNRKLNSPIFTCDNSIINSMKYRYTTQYRPFKNKNSSMDKIQFLSLWKHNVNEITKCLNVVVKSKPITSLSFNPIGNGIYLFDSPFIAKPRNALFPYQPFTLNDYNETPIETIWNSLLDDKPIRLQSQISFIMSFLTPQTNTIEKLNTCFVLKHVKYLYLHINSNTKEIKYTIEYLRSKLWEINQLKTINIPESVQGDSLNSSDYKIILSLQKLYNDRKEYSFESFRLKTIVLELFEKEKTFKTELDKLIIQKNQLGFFGQTISDVSNIDLQRFGIWVSHPLYVKRIL